MMGQGIPSDTQSNFQSRTNRLTMRTILPGVIGGPDGYLRGSFCPVASTLTFVPPMSITRTLRAPESFIFHNRLGFPNARPVDRPTFQTPAFTALPCGLEGGCHLRDAC